jgi:hypothetical protein
LRINNNSNKYTRQRCVLKIILTNLRSNLAHENKK